MYESVVGFPVKILILTSSLFKVVTYPAAWRAGVATLTSSLRPRCYIYSLIHQKSGYLIMAANPIRNLLNYSFHVTSFKHDIPHQGVI